MVWSYSRIKTFDDCPYRFFLKYISECESVDKFYASYGLFMHELIEGYYKNRLTKEEMAAEFLSGFSSKVLGDRPSESIVKKYICCGLDYLKDFKPFDYNTVAVEKNVDFKIEGMNFVARIDYIGEKDGKYYIVDNKSRDLKNRSKRKKPTATDVELDNMLRQLYIYSAAFKEMYGEFPSALCFNCFKNNTFIVEEFKMDEYIKTIEWAKRKIRDIRESETFDPNIEFFSCKYICDVSNDCIYNQYSRK